MAVWQGLFLKGSLVHGEHRFDFPVFMTREPDLRTFLLAYLGPPLLSYTLNTLLVRPLWRRHRLKKVCPHYTLTIFTCQFTSIQLFQVISPHLTPGHPLPNPPRLRNPLTPPRPTPPDTTPPHPTPLHPLMFVTSIILTLNVVVKLIFNFFFPFCSVVSCGHHLANLAPQVTPPPLQRNAHIPVAKACPLPTLLQIRLHQCLVTVLIFILILALC